MPSINHPRTFAVSIAIIFCALFSASARTNCPALLEDYRDPSGKVLARSGGVAVTETELMLHLALSENKNPNIYNKYRLEENPLEKRKLEETLKENVASWFATRKLAGDFPLEKSVNPLKLRVASYPLYELVWVDEIVRPEVVIQKEDLVAYYRRHENEYELPASVRIRVFRTPAALTMPEMERQKLRDEIEALREEAASGADFESIVKEKSAPYPAADEDGVIRIYDSPNYNRFYDEAQKLDEGGYSPVFQRGDGFYFIRLLDRRDPEGVPLSSVADEIRRKLELRSLRYLYSLKLRELKKELAPSVTWLPWEEMNDDHPLIKVGDAAITKGEFWRLYPEIMDEDFKLDKAFVNARAKKLIDFECIRYDVERSDLAGHPFISRGMEITRKNLAAIKAMEKKAAGLKRVTQAELQTYYENNVSRYSEKAWKELLQPAGEIIHAEQYLMEDRLSLLVKMERDFKKMIEDARELAAGEKARAEADGEEPEYDAALFKDLPRRYAKDQYRFFINRPGRVQPGSHPELWKELRNVDPGEFSEIKRVSLFVYSYFVTDENPGKAKAFDDVRKAVKEDLIRSRMKRLREETEAKVTGEDSIRYEFD